MASLFKVAAIAGILALVVFKSSTAYTAIASTLESPATEARSQAAVELVRGESNNVRTAGVIRVTGEVTAVTLIIVDEDGSITEIWSNSGGEASKVIARRGSRTGPEIAVTPSILRGAKRWSGANVQPGAIGLD